MSWYEDDASSTQVSAPARGRYSISRFLTFACMFHVQVYARMAPSLESVRKTVS
jgi:hypothetical protein